MWDFIRSINPVLASVISITLGIILLVIADKTHNGGLSIFAVLLLCPFIFLLIRGANKE